MQTRAKTRWEPACRRYPANEHGADVRWAHASGWAQLNGARRSVSCVVPVRNELTALRALLPVLSDVLTECGFPWEIIVVDCASRDGTEPVLRAWCELPGYRLIALDHALDRASAIVLGLEAARGDAVILLDACSEHPLSMLNEMVMRWEGGCTLIHLARDPYSGESVLRVASAPGGAIDGPDLQPAGHSGSLVLLDRAVVRELLR